MVTRQCPDGGETRRSSRRRKSRRVGDFETLETKEAKFLQEAVKASLVTSMRGSLEEIPEAPVYRPTEDQFKDPIAFINSIRPEAEQHGVIKIIPPASWKPPSPRTLQVRCKFGTRLQPLKRMQEAVGFDDGAQYSVSEYREMAADFFKKTFGDCEVDSEVVERRYWDIVKGRDPSDVHVEYGNDIDSDAFGSGFPVDADHEYSKHPWNLNNFASLPGSVIGQLPASISGVNAPWVYFGMLFSTFCWHAEDLWMYSVNYNHFGAAKTWYGCPGAFLHDLEKVVRDQVPDLFRKEPDLMLKLVTMISPSVLVASGIPVNRTVQRAGEFVVTFPKAYHAGFNQGFNCTEAVNFATEDWIAHGLAAMEEYRKHSRRSVFSPEKLLLDISIAASKARSRHPELVPVLRSVIDSERHLRKETKRLGLEKWTQSRTNDDEPMEEPPSCFLCHQFCHLSYACCACAPDRISCLGHMRMLCACKPDLLTGHMRFSLEDLELIAESL